MRAFANGPADKLPVLNAGKTEVVVCYPDELLHDAIAKMLRHGVGRLPVVARNEPDRLVGYLGRGEVLAARMRHHEEEESRNQGPLLNGRKRFKLWPVFS